MIDRNLQWNGRSWSCRKCVGITDKASRKRRRERDPAAYIIAELSRNAKKRGQDFSITKADLLPMPTHCPVFGVLLDYSGSAAINTASVDRIDSSKGYASGNVAIISKRANTIKNNATAGELRQILYYMLRMRVV